MSRIDRLKEYAKPARKENWSGASRDMANIDRWSDRAHDESDAVEHRASTRKTPKLQDTGTARVHSSSKPPRHDPAVDARMVAKRDTNTAGLTGYARGIRRDA